MESLEGIKPFFRPPEHVEDAFDFRKESGGCDRRGEHTGRREPAEELGLAHKHIGKITGVAEEAEQEIAVSGVPEYVVEEPRSPECGADKPEETRQRQIGIGGRFQSPQ